MEENGAIQRTQISINTKKKEKVKRQSPEEISPTKKRFLPDHILNEKRNSLFDVTLIERSTRLPKDNLTLSNSLNTSIAAGPNYECFRCRSTYFSGTKLKMHYLMEHGVKFCKLCDLLIETEEEETHHNELIHSKVTCEICHKDIEGEITGHYKTEHNATLCPYCGVLLYPEQHLDKHIIEKHCVLEKFVQEGNLDLIIKKNDRGSEFHCLLCDKLRYKELFGHFSYFHKLNIYYLLDIFTKNSVELRLLQLNDAENQKMDSIKPRHGCKGCKLLPTKEVPLSLHRVYCVGGLPCSVCLKNFDTADALAVHYMDNHKVFKCELECENVKFGSSGELEEHYHSIHNMSRCKLCEDFTMDEIAHNIDMHKVTIAKIPDRLLVIDEDNMVCTLCEENLTEYLDSLKDLTAHFKNDHSLSHRKLAILIGKRPATSNDSESASESESETNLPIEEYKFDFDTKQICCLFDLSHPQINLPCEICKENFDSGINLIKHMHLKHTLKLPDEYIKDEKGFDLAQFLNKLRGEEMSFNCPKCNITILNGGGRQHILEEHSEDLEELKELGLKCKNCDAVFWDYIQMEDHTMENHHETINHMECSKCSELFISIKLFMNHGCDFRDIAYECMACFLVYPTILEIREHFNKHHPKMRVVMCPQTDCLRTFAKMKYAKNHYKHVHLDKKAVEGSYECAICGRVFTTQKGYLLHTKNSHAKGFKCVICGEKFQTSEVRKHHYATVHPGELLYECTECLRTFLSKSGLHVHKKMHKEFSNVCPYCNKEFFRRDSYKEHLLIHIGPKHQCPYCTKSFTQKSNLRRHIRLHTGEKPYNCPYCPKKFSDKGACNSHVTVHTKEHECYCEVCGKKFSKQQKLKYHMKRHTGEGLAKCDICQRSFTSQYDLRKHVTIHTQQTQIICQCGRAFSAEKYLRTHIKVVHDPNRSTSKQNSGKFNCYQCLVCNNIYSLRTTILKHLRKVHKFNSRQYNKYIRQLEPEEEAMFTRTVIKEEVDDSKPVENVDESSHESITFVKTEIEDTIEEYEVASTSQVEEVVSYDKGRVRNRKHKNPIKYLGGNEEEVAN